MRIIDLIEKLQALRTSLAHPEYLEMMGEPEICIDVFKAVDEDSHLFEYAGFHTGEILFELTGDGVYHLMSAFAESYPKKCPSL
jgi:hypothetical protein